jgi:hypothetical protein
MRINELVQGRQKNQIQHSENPILIQSRKIMQKTDQILLPASVNTTATVVQVPARELPLFMEPVFKAKDFDPL